MAGDSRSSLPPRHAALSDPGRVRADNQDSWLADAAAGLFLVADGMGGMAAGATASKAVAETLPGLVAVRVGGLPERGAAAALEEAIAECSGLIRARADADPALKGMGSTLALVLTRQRRAFVASLGDSRVYALSGGKLKRLTKDHTVVAVMVEKGRITEAQAKSHPLRHSLGRFMGMPGRAGADVKLVRFKSKARLLLCSDGLTNMLTDAAIQKALSAEADPQAACRRLVDAANAAGGEDNVTVLVVDI